MTSGVRSGLAGLRLFAAAWRTVARTAWAPLALYLAGLLIALPLAVALAYQVRGDLDRSVPASAAGELDAEWWAEYRGHARGLAATFVPAAAGVSAPLSNLSALLEATPRAWILVGPVSAYLLAGTWIWAGLLVQWTGRARPRLSEFAAGANARFTDVLRVNLAAMIAVGLSFAVLHPVLFGPLLNGLLPADGSERTAFLGRLAAYAAFGGWLVTLGVCADYARIVSVSGPRRSLAAIARVAVGLIRERWRPISVVLLMTACCAALLLFAYAAVELRGGTRVGGWRAVLLAQGYVLARVGLRAIHVAAHVGVARGA